MKPITTTIAAIVECITFPSSDLSSASIKREKVCMAGDNKNEIIILNEYFPVDADEANQTIEQSSFYTFNTKSLEIPANWRKISKQITVMSATSGLRVKTTLFLLQELN
ncbi:hypothetical protein KIN20_024646 [Parelaphostrongylus tenuis]|uniref:Uncharacterized protein n=1 Tax=Parelaphostrongylus tenuis TaxID=148309 RepID=A0AAD5QW34_PARTN|nr:hypothetical protein KIN20_024646 [Parelaphostrongylus tenuis]